MAVGDDPLLASKAAAAEPPGSCRDPFRGARWPVTQTGGVAGSVPLSTLLSHVLVAFTIEVDNEFERQMPHRTTVGRRAGEPARDPWLVSLPMWARFLQFVPPDGITVSELEWRSFGDSDLRGRNPGMVRWGYVSLQPDPGDPRARPPLRDWLVRPTEAGRGAQEIWQSLPTAVEERWAGRFGADATAGLRRSLTALVDQLEFELSDYLPTNGAHSGRADVAVRPLRATSAAQIDLSALLSKVLLAFTLDFEADSPLSLVMSANPVRALAEESVAVRNLPRLTGVARETLHVMLHFLEYHGHCVVEREGGSKVARLTASGKAAQRDYQDRVGMVESAWTGRFGPATVAQLRLALEPLVGDTVLARSPLAAAIEPPAGGWRAAVARPEVLPHHPVVSHRGGYPDGS